jgi:hypothetical protein
MPTILINIQNPSDLKLFQELANKTGAKIQPLTNDEILELGLENEPDVTTQIEIGLREVKKMLDGEMPMTTLEEMLHGK